LRTRNPAMRKSNGLARLKTNEIRQTLLLE
jgi:hypothetical protein